MLIENTRRVIKDVASLPATGQSNSIYHNTTDGFFYYWNDVTGKYVKLEPLDALTTVQPTPTATGNTTNLNKVFKDANGSTWFVDSNGDAILMGSAVFKEQNRFYADPNGLDANNGANESPKLTVQAAVSALGQGDIAIVNEGVYSGAVTMSLQNTSISGADSAVNSLAQIGALAVTTASGTSNRVSDLTVLGAVTHSGGAPLYLHSVTVNGNYVSTSAAYEEINDCRLQDGTITKTTAGTIYIKDSLIGNASFNTPNTVVSLDNVSIDAGDILTIGAGVIYMLNDVRGHVVIDPAAIPLNTVAVTQGLSGLAAKSTETASFNDIRLTNVPTITTATKALVRDSNGVVSEQTLPSAAVNFGASAPSGTAVKGDTYYKTTDGTSAGSVLETYHYDGTSWVLVTRNQYTKITSLVPKVYLSSAYVNAQANNINNVADAFLLSDGTYLDSGVLTITGHGYTVGRYYYLSQTVAGGVTDVYPVTGISQQLFFVHDANTLIVDIEQAVNPDTPSYANLVYVNNVNVNNGSIYDLNNPPATNNNGLKGDSNNLYIGTDGSTWIWNGTAYVTKTFASSTEWNLAGTQVDAQGNKTGNISRAGFVTIGKDVNTNLPIDVYGKGTAQYSVVARFTNPDNIVAGNNTQMVFGAQQAAGNCSDWRFYYAGNASGSNRIDFGMSGRTSPMISYLYNGNVGVNTTAPGSQHDVNGSFGFSIRGSGSSTSQTDSDGTVVFTVPNAIYTLLAPTANTNRRVISVKNQTTGNITVIGHIDGVAATNYIIQGGGGVIFQSNGSSWWAIADNTPTGKTQISARANRGTDLTLDNLKFRVAATGNASLQVSTVSGTVTLNGTSQANTDSFALVSTLVVTTTPVYVRPALAFLNAGDTQRFLFNTTDNKSYEVRLVVDPGYTSNLIHIQRLH